jgi:NitT/TauT family transport system ATP-binding protein
MPVVETQRVSQAPPVAFVQATGAGIAYRGGIEALRDVTFSMAQGEFVSLVGPSGCGKSTLLKGMAGLVPVTTGNLRIGPDGSVAAGRTRVGFVFQEPTLLSWRTVAGNVRLPLELRREERDDADTRIHEALRRVGLEDFARVYPPQLSGGMQMRTSLARALITRPDLLLLDEPFGALDDITRQRLNEDLISLWLRDCWNGLFVTHNVAEAVYLGQRVLVMSDRPGSVAGVIEIPLSYPRAPAVRTTVEFNQLVSQVSELLANVTNNRQGETTEGVKH